MIGIIVLKDEMDPQQFLKRLGRNLREQRTVRGLSQTQLAKSAGISARYLLEIEAGRGNLSLIKLLKLTRALGITLHEALRVDKWHPIVALIGLRGAGKTSVGRIVGEELGRPFTELDALIEEAAGLSLAEIFAIHGEAYYRRLERDVLSQFVSSTPPTVLATGGSIVTEPATFDLLKRSALTVWLKARPELHLARVAAQGDPRPMAGRANPLAELRTLLREREPWYRQADISIDTSALNPEEVAHRLMQMLRPAEDFAWDRLDS